MAPPGGGAIRRAAQAFGVRQDTETRSVHVTDDDVLFGFRLQLLARAGQTSVSEACRVFGVHRSTYYRWKRQVDRHGLELLRRECAGFCVCMTGSLSGGVGRIAA